jgi:hypothetical protein
MHFLEHSSFESILPNEASPSFMTLLLVHVVHNIQPLGLDMQLAGMPVFPADLKNQE